jgi:hypothetical protein
MQRQAWWALVAFLSVSLLSGSIRAEDFRGCPVEGDGGDPALNRLKNRTEVPPAYEALHFEDLAGLEVPTGVSKSARSKWPQSTLDALEPQEKRAVAVVGYLLAVKLEGRESPNCHSDEPAERDFHIWLANSPDDERAEAVVVEVTPRIRALHKRWTTGNLKTYVQLKTRVRISGWLMLDPEHPDQVGKTRATLWEIHPITKIEAWIGEKWVEL